MDVYPLRTTGTWRRVEGVPAWLARLIAGEDAVMGATQSRGASNAKAKRELGWTLHYPTWRQGFPAVYRARNHSTI